MNDLTPTTTIGFSPALPCCTLVAPDQMCGKPATVGALYPIGHGNHILQPFCRECVQAVQRVYGPPEELFPPPPGPKLTIVGRRKRGGEES